MTALKGFEKCDKIDLIFDIFLLIVGIAKVLTAVVCNYINIIQNPKEGVWGMIFSGGVEVGYSALGNFTM